MNAMSSGSAIIDALEQMHRRAALGVRFACADCAYQDQVRQALYLVAQMGRGGSQFELKSVCAEHLYT